MKDEINKEKLIHKMESKNIKVVSIDKENKTYTCEDGMEYPLVDGCEDFTIEQLQYFIDHAKAATLGMLKIIEEEQ